MASINKINVYTCDTCKRNIEKLVDGSRPDPIRCNITQNCRGKLSLSNTHFGIQPKTTQPVSGLVDWEARGGTTSQTSIDTSVIDIPISSFNNYGLALAGPQYRDYGVGNTIRDFFIPCLDGTDFVFETLTSSDVTTLNSSISFELFELSPEVLSYRHYTYTAKGSISVVEGTDNSSSQISLQFNNDNIIKIFVNGIELPLSRYDRSVLNRISFTPKLIESNLVVDVFIYNNIRTYATGSNTKTITFKSLNPSNTVDLITRNSCSWGDVAAVNINGTKKVLLFCNDLGVLDVTKTYAISKVYATASNLSLNTPNPSSLEILFGDQPNSFNDKKTNVYVSGVSFLSSFVLSFKLDPSSGGFIPTVTNDLITNTINQVIIDHKLTNGGLTNPLGQVKTTFSSVATAIQSSYILGPC
jgi:hypothetical protein